MPFEPPVMRATLPESDMIPGAIENRSRYEENLGERMLSQADLLALAQGYHRSFI